jgi:glycosyltransferase involved in cell wall biosynthesis
LRVLHVIQELGAGGAERILSDLVEGTRRAGHEVAVAAAPGTLSAEMDAPVFPMPLVQRHLRRVPQAVVALDSATRRVRPDTLHVHNPGMAAVAGVTTVRGKRVRGLVTVHGVPDEDYAAAKRVLRIAGLPVVACGPGVARGLADQGFEVAATIVNAVSLPPPPADGRDLRRQWGFAPDHALIVSVGRLVPVKNHTLAVTALARVPRGDLAIVGEGPLHASLRRQADTEGLGDRVAFAGFRDDARAIIGAADVVVLPSTSEGLPLVALEALAAGTPLVATAVRGIKELLTHEDNALLVPPNDPVALASAINLALDDTELRERLRAGGRRLTEAHSTEAMIAAYLRFYELVTTRADSSETR